MKKGILSLIIILLTGGYVFYRGFVSYKVPAGHYAVMVSKTSGVDKNVITGGKFCWKWEPVIPVNSRLYVFSNETYSSRQTFNGSLPSAEIYSTLVKGNPNFTYSFDFEIYLSISADSVVKLVSSGEVTDQESLNLYLEKTSEAICRDVSQQIIDMNENKVIAVYDLPAILNQMNIQAKYADVTVKEVFVKNASVPDIRLYKIAQNSYEKFQAVVDSELAVFAKEHAQTIMAEERSVKKLTQIGEMLKQYPELNNLLSNGSAADVLKALNELK